MLNVSNTVNKQKRYYRCVYAILPTKAQVVLNYPRIHIAEYLTLNIYSIMPLLSDMVNRDKHKRYSHIFSYSANIALHRDYIFL